MGDSGYRDKLFALLAIRLGRIEAEKLRLTFEHWLRNQDVSLIETLHSHAGVDRASLIEVDRGLDCLLALYSNDVEACYEALASQGMIPEFLLLDPTAGMTPLQVAEDAEKTIVMKAPGVPEDDQSTVTLGNYVSGGVRYQLGRLVGKGGQGEVYEAIDKELNREVLIKQVAQKFANDPEARSRFIRETRTGAILEHPGIVPVYDIGQHPGGKLFQVMRYFRPGSLHKKIASFHLSISGRPDELSFRTLLTHFTASCRAIDFAHSRGILHLDIKPKNIVTGEFGETQIIDWGLAQITDGDMRDKVEGESGNLTGGSSRGDSGKSGTNSKPKIKQRIPRGLQGTAAYASPEQWRWDPSTITKQTDVYGLGATLFEILAGKPPFQANSPTIEEDVEIGNLHHEFKTWVSPSLRAICRKALEVKPENRYQSAGELADDIERYLADEPVLAFPDPILMKLWRYAKKHKTIVATTTAIMASTILALAIGNVLISKQRDIAKKNASMTRQVIKSFIVKVADDKWSEIPGTGPLRLEAVEDVVTEFPEIIAQQPNDPQLQFDAADIYRRCGNLYRVLGQVEQADELYSKSQNTLKSLIRSYPNGMEYQLELCQTYIDEAEVISREHGSKDAVEKFRLAVDLASQMNTRFRSQGSLQTLARARNDLASALTVYGSIEEALVISEQAVDDYKKIIKKDSGNNQEERAQNQLLACLALITATETNFELGRYSKAAEYSQEANSIAAELSIAFEGNPNVDYISALARIGQSKLLSRDEQTRVQGRSIELSALEVLRKLVKDAGSESNFRPALCDLLCIRSQAFLDDGQNQIAFELAEEAIQSIQAFDKPTGAIETKTYLARAYRAKGLATLALGDFETAQSHLKKSMDYFKVVLPTVSEDHPIQEQATEVARSLER